MSRGVHCRGSQGLVQEARRNVRVPTKATGGRCQEYALRAIRTVLAPASENFQHVFVLSRSARFPREYQKGGGS
jgi:hypothetical protein